MMFWKRILGIITLLLIAVLAVPTAAQSSTVFVSTQRFDSGLMVYRADTSAIWVLADNGEAWLFELKNYGQLQDIPFAFPPPGHIKPMFGFGKVWHHNALVRELLGWPILPEIGFPTTIRVQNGVTLMTELDGSLLQINSDGTWSRLPNSLPSPTVPPTPTPNCAQGLFWGQAINDGPPCPDAPKTMRAAYQPFEKGFMIWLSGQGDVWVFINAHPNFMPLWSHFAQSDYAGFQDAPAQTPPAGKYQPINAFGRVWNNLTDLEGRKLSQELGWATARETGYTATYQLFGRTSHFHRYFSLPDEHVVDVYQGLAGLNWTLAK